MHALAGRRPHGRQGQTGIAFSSSRAGYRFSRVHYTRIRAAHCRRAASDSALKPDYEAQALRGLRCSAAAHLPRCQSRARLYSHLSGSISPRAPPRLGRWPSAGHHSDDAPMALARLHAFQALFMSSRVELSLHDSASADASAPGMPEIRRYLPLADCSP